MVEKKSEYTRIFDELNSHLGKQSITELQENKDRQDITYLANKTGWDARLVAMVSLAEKYYTESTIPSQFYYALFRAKVPTTEDRLYRTNSNSAKKIWEKAIEKNIIDESLKEKIEENVKKFQDFSCTYLLDKDHHAGISSLKELLDLSLPDTEKQREFINLFYNRTDTNSDFWKTIETKFGKQTADKLKLDGKVGYLTENNVKLIQKLYTNEILKTDPADLIKKGFYKKETWDEIIDDTIEIPKETPGESPEEKKNNYIANMVFQLNLCYPTLVVAEMINNNDLPMNDPVKNKVYQVLYEINEKFRIGRDSLGKVLKDNNIKLEKEPLMELKKLERVFQLSPSDDTMKVLWGKKIDSARTVVQYDESEFVKTFEKSLGGADTAKLIYAKAQQIHSTVLNLAISYLSNRNSPSLYVLSSSGDKKND